MQNKSLYKKKPRPLDWFIHGLIYICASLSIIILACIVTYVGYKVFHLLAEFYNYSTKCNKRNCRNSG